MPFDSIFRDLARHGVVPVIAIDAVEHAAPLGDALIEGGLPLAEVTFRTPAAAAVIAELRKCFPEMLVGAGTVLTTDNLKAALDAGAQFAVAPGLNPAVVAAAADCQLPFVPGVCTPSEIEHALALGCHTLKFFPAEACGGVEMLKAFAGPYAHTGVRFAPTGGVTGHNAAAYLALPMVAAVGGTWIARPDDLVHGRWQEIRSRAAEAAMVVAQVRGAAA